MRFRRGCILALVAVWFSILGLRLYYLQVTRHSHYLAKARDQQMRLVDATGLRGRILDTRGRILAASAMVPTVIANPQEIVDIVGTARLVASQVPWLDAEELRGRLTRDADFVFLARRLSPARADRIMGLQLPGLRLINEQGRFYPMRGEGAQVIGLCGSEDAGLSGLELYHEASLRGASVTKSLMRDAHRGVLSFGWRAEPRRGGNLQVSLDIAVQDIVERTIRDMRTAAMVDGATVIVLSSTSGVMAMTSVPPTRRQPESGSADSQQRIGAIRDYYDFGLIYYFLVASAGVESGMVSDSVIRSLAAEPREKTWSALLAQLSDAELTSVLLEDLGFGRLTGIDLPGERRGVVLRSDRPNSGLNGPDSARLVGTALQLSVALSTLANGGLRFAPYLAGKPRQPTRVMAEATTRGLQGLWSEEILEGHSPGFCEIDLRTRPAILRWKTLHSLVYGPLDGPGGPAAIDGLFAWYPSSGYRVYILVFAECTAKGANASCAKAIFRQIATQLLRYERQFPGDR